MHYMLIYSHLVLLRRGQIWMKDSIQLFQHFLFYDAWSDNFVCVNVKMAVDQSRLYIMILRMFVKINSKHSISQTIFKSKWLALHCIKEGLCNVRFPVNIYAVVKIQWWNVCLPPNVYKIGSLYLINLIT